MHCILSSLASLLLLRCLHLLDVHAVRSLLYPSQLQLSPSELLLFFSFSFSASASVVSAVLPSSFCLRLGFSAAASCLISSSSSWYFSSNVNASLSASSLPIHARVFPIVVVQCLSLLASREQFFLCIDHECCHDTSVVTDHVDYVFGFSIFTVFQVSSLDQNVVNLFLSPFRRPASRLLSRCFSVHRIECCEVLYHVSLLQPVSSFVAGQHTGTLHSVSWAQFGFEVSSHYLYALLSCVPRLFCTFHSM